MLVLYPHSRAWGPGTWQVLRKDLLRKCCRGSPLGVGPRAGHSVQKWGKSSPLPSGRSQGRAGEEASRGGLESAERGCTRKGGRSRLRAGCVGFSGPLLSCSGRRGVCLPLSLPGGWEPLRTGPVLLPPGREASGPGLESSEGRVRQVTGQEHTDRGLGRGSISEAVSSGCTVDQVHPGHFGSTPQSLSEHLLYSGTLLTLCS